MARLGGYRLPIPPLTYIVGTCPEQGLGLPPGGHALIRWRSDDFEGEVVGYEYRVTGPESPDTSFVFVPASVESVEVLLDEPGVHRFVVRAVDNEGLRDPEPPEVIIPVNPGYGFPALKLSTDVGGRIEYRGQGPVAGDFPDTLFAGERVTFSWQADASMYCSSVTGYRSAWDDSLDFSSLPDPADTTFTVVLEPGEHVLRVCAVDDLGYSTVGELHLTAIPLLPETDVLFVDDCNLLWAPDPLEDAFYDTLLSGRDWQEWDPTEHMSGGVQQPPPVSMLARANCVVWSVDNSGPALASFEEGGYGPLEGYVRGGGNLILAGFCPTEALARAPSYPIAFADGEFLHDHGGLAEARNTGGRTIQSPPTQFGYAFLGARACEGTDLADVWVDSLGKWSGQYWRGGLPYCDAYTPTDDADVLYLFDAYVNTAFEGAPCGVRKLGTEGEGSVVTLGFPLYFLKTAGATSMMGCLLDGLLEWQEPSELLSMTWSAAADSVVLSWSGDPESGVQGFEVLRRDAGSVAYTSLTPTPIPGSPSGESTFADRSVEPGRSYEYALSVIERWGGRTLHGTWSIATPSAAPSALSLSVAQNPAGGSVTLRLGIPEPGGRTLVRVHNAAGKLVATVHDGELDPGVREIVWNCTGDDGRSVATGVYFGDASAGGSTVRAKLVVLR